MSSPLNASDNKRILHITRNLPPLVGGMERLNWHIVDELSRQAQVHVIGPTGAAEFRPEQSALTEVPLRPLWRFLLTSAWQAVITARAWKPHVVMAGSGLTAPAALMSARLSNAKSCVYLHGLDAAVQHPIYRAIWHPAIRNMDIVIANSQSTAKLALDLGVSEQKLHIIPPGVTIPKNPQPLVTVERFRQRHGLGNNRLLLSIGRLTTRKGLREFVANALPLIVQKAPDTLLVVIGDTPKDSLHASVQTRESVQAVADAAGIGHHIRFLGVITNKTELACAYECATLHVFPVRSLPGDPEGFGMVAIEAAAHGLPTVAFATGGVIDAVSDGKTGFLIENGNYMSFSKKVIQAINNKSNMKNSCLAFAEKFSWAIFSEKLSKVISPNS